MMFPASVIAEKDDILLLNFKYIEHNVCGPGVNIDFTKSMYPGCQCINNECHHGTCTCITRYGSNYDTKGVLIKHGYCLPVFECNSNCMCSAVCTNRLTQRSVQIELEIFQTKSRGLGVRTLKEILKGKYICEYCGEIISYKEAKERTSMVVGQNENTYLLVIREHSGENKVLKTHIDARKQGNVARFMNHSCEPNMELVPVRDNTPVPRLCLFAARDIKVGEELTLNYGDGGSYNNTNGDSLTNKTKMKLRKECLCGSSTCMKYLPFDEGLFIDV